MDINEYKNKIQEIRGKTVAVVYIFEGENAPGFEHYWIWKSDIISGWLNAIQELQCVPYIIDVRTFIHKAICNTLPPIDYVLNLNCGSCRLSSMSLVPSMCSFLKIPCIPCDSEAIIVGEDKILSNYLAITQDIQIPQNLSKSNKNGIFRPKNLGSSIGVQKGSVNTKYIDGLYQEFIPGYDVTIPLMFNPSLNRIDILPPLIYIPDSNDPNWIYDTDEKYAEKEHFKKVYIKNIADDVKTKLLKFASIFPITTYGRIDARIKFNGSKLMNDISELHINSGNFYFIEMNSMPTIEYEDTFSMSFDIAREEKDNTFYDCINTYCSIVGNKSSMIGFLLSSAMLSFISRC